MLSDRSLAVQLPLVPSIYLFSATRCAFASEMVLSSDGVSELNGSSGGANELNGGVSESVGEPNAAPSKRACEFNCASDGVRMLNGSSESVNKHADTGIETATSLK